VDPDSTVAFTVVLAVLGLGWCAGVVAGSTILVASLPEAERPRAEGVGELAMGVAAGAGAMLAGLVVAVGGFPVFAIATAAVSLVILLQVTSPPRAASAPAGPAPARPKVSI
jgi:MFS family permease